MRCRIKITAFGQWAGGSDLVELGLDLSVQQPVDPTQRARDVNRHLTQSPGPRSVADHARPLRLARRIQRAQGDEGRSRVRRTVLFSDLMATATSVSSRSTNSMICAACVGRNARTETVNPRWLLTEIQRARPQGAFEMRGAAHELVHPVVVQMVLRNQSGLQRLDLGVLLSRERLELLRQHCRQTLDVTHHRLEILPNQFVLGAVFLNQRLLTTTLVHSSCEAIGSGIGSQSRLRTSVHTWQVRPHLSESA